MPTTQAPWKVEAAWSDALGILADYLPRDPWKEAQDILSASAAASGASPEGVGELRAGREPGYLKTAAQDIRNVVSDYAARPQYLAPFLRSAFKLQDRVNYKKAKKVLAEPITGAGGEEVARQMAARTVNQYEADNQAVAEHATTIPGAVARGEIEMAPYMAEFALGGAVLGLGTKAATIPLATRGAIGAAKRVAGQLAKWIGIGAARATLDIGGVGVEAMRRQDVAPGESPALSLAKAFATQTIAMASEASGETIMKGVRHIPGVGKVIGKVDDLLKGIWMKGGGNAATYSAVVKRAGYDGLLAEMSEDDLQGFLQAVLNLNPETVPPEQRTLLRRVWNAVPNARERTVQALTLALPMLPGGAMRAQAAIAEQRAWGPVEEAAQKRVAEREQERIGFEGYVGQPDVMHPQAEPREGTTIMPVAEGVGIEPLGLPKTDAEWATWTAANPMLATQVAEAKQASRRAFIGTGFGDLSRENRETVAATIRRVLGAQAVQPAQAAPEGVPGDRQGQEGLQREERVGQEPGRPVQDAGASAEAARPSRVLQEAQEVAPQAPPAAPASALATEGVPTLAEHAAIGEAARRRVRSQAQRANERRGLMQNRLDRARLAANVPADDPGLVSRLDAIETATNREAQTEAYNAALEYIKGKAAEATKPATAEPQAPVAEPPTARTRNQAAFLQEVEASNLPPDEKAVYRDMVGQLSPDVFRKPVHFRALEVPSAEAIAVLGKPPRIAGGATWSERGADGGEWISATIEVYRHRDARIFPHEVGHVGWATLLDAADRATFSRWWGKEAEATLRGLGRGLLKDASKSPQEAFADLFAAWVNRRYVPANATVGVFRKLARKAVMLYDRLRSVPQYVSAEVAEFFNRIMPGITKETAPAEAPKPISPAQQAQAEGKGQVSRDIRAPLEELLQRPEVIVPKGKTKPSAAEQAQTEADKGPEVKHLGVGPGSLLAWRSPARSTKIGPSIPAARPELEADLRANDGIPHLGPWEKLKGLAITAWHQFTRHAEFVPKTREFAPFNELFRLFLEIARTQQDEALRIVAAVIDPLGPQEYADFKRMLLYKDARESEGLGNLSGFKWQPGEPNAEIARLQPAIDASPAIQKALAMREAIRQDTLAQLADYDLMPNGVDRNDYWHRQVMAYQQLNGRVGTPRGPRKAKRGFQRARVIVDPLNPAHDLTPHNTDFVQAESEWLSDALVEIGKAKWRAQLMQLYDIMPKVRHEAAALSKAQGRPVTWQEVWRANYRDTHADWQLTPGNLLYPATTIPERIAEDAIATGAKFLDVPTEQLRKVLALGGPNPTYLLPKEIVQQLNAMLKPPQRGPLGRVFGNIQNGLKWVYTQAPWRIVHFTVQNFTGDCEPVWVALPTAFKRYPKAMGELWRYGRGNLSLSPEMRIMRDLGVIDSGFTAQELPDLKDLPIFRRFYNERATGGRRLIQEYPEMMRRLSNFRENIARYATFMEYREQLKNGTLTDYGGAKKSTVEALKDAMGVDVAAAHLSRNLIGDYGNLTVTGQWIRQNLFFFHSWFEINTKRWPRMAINKIDWANVKAQGYPIALGGYLTIAALQFASFYALTQAWNHLMFPDDEKGLSPGDRAVPHIIYAHNADGTTGIFRNVGALSDFMEWAGVNDTIALWPLIQSGQMGAKGLAKELGTQTMSRLVGMLRPDIKGFFEFVGGQSYWPNPFNPRSVPRDEAVAGIVGLPDAYREVRGIVFADGSRARPHTIQRLTLGVTDPRQNALGEFGDLRARFLESKGKPRPPSYGRSKTRLMQDAALAGDYKAFVEARRVYIKNGGQLRQFKISLAYLDPVERAGDNKMEYEFVHKYLTPDQRSRLSTVRDEAHKLQVLMTLWWMQASTDEANTKE